MKDTNFHSDSDWALYFGAAGRDRWKSGGGFKLDITAVSRPSRADNAAECRVNRPWMGPSAQPRHLAVMSTSVIPHSQDSGSNGFGAEDRRFRPIILPGQWPIGAAVFVPSRASDCRSSCAVAASPAGLVMAQRRPITCQTAVARLTTDDCSIPACFFNDEEHLWVFACFS